MSGFAWPDDEFRKSSFSDQQQCVELRGDGGAIMDSKNGDVLTGAGIAFALVAAVKSGAIRMPDAQ